MALKHYAQRLLNPFRGVMNVIEFEAAEAVTTDGLHWDIYVRNAELVSDMPDSHRVQTSDIRYGSWSQQQGLKRGSLYPSDDFMFLEHMGAIVFEYLQQLHTHVPFPLQDHFELWLLDKQQQPLALIDSQVSEQRMELDLPLDWRAGLECRNHFDSPVYQQHLADNDSSAGSYLTRYINSLAEDTPRAQWFQRDHQGSGIGLQGINLGNAHHGRELPADAFHPLMLSCRQHDELHRQLIEQFFDWQAPWLLLLHHLQPTQRKHFEQQAKKRALTVDQQYPLYPEVVDQTQLNAARVEAKLRKSSGRSQRQEEVISPHYIELCPDPTLEP